MITSPMSLFFPDLGPELQDVTDRDPWTRHELLGSRNRRTWSDLGRCFSTRESQQIQKSVGFNRTSPMLLGVSWFLMRTAAMSTRAGFFYIKKKKKNVKSCEIQHSKTIVLITHKCHK